MADDPHLPLRAHHLLCVLKYQGKGYSSEFVSNFDRIWQGVKTGRYTHAIARSVADPICHACPHLSDQAEPTSCHFHDSIGARDRRLLEKMGWKEGTVVPLLETLSTLQRRHAELLEVVCSGCEWLPICREGTFTLLDAPKE